jgi:hypothetical protein
MTSPSLEARLNQFYATIQLLSPSSSNAEFEAFGTFFAPECKAWLKNMREFDDPGIGRQNVIGKLKEIMREKHWRLADRQVLSSSVASNGLQVFNETKKRLLVCGVPVDPFYETEVVLFNSQGLITELKLYSCWSPIASVIQQQTGMGPYKEATYKAQGSA